MQTLLKPAELPKLDPALVKWFNGLRPVVRQKFMADIARQAAHSRARLNPRYKAFQATYFDDWPAFVNDCFIWDQGKGPTPYQMEIIAELQTRRRAAVRGPHGLGKTALASWVVLAFALTRDGLDWKLPTTASAWRQLTKYLWPEVHKWSRRIRWDKVGRPPFIPRQELLGLSLKLGTGEAFAVASDNHELIEGAHADQLLYLFDESKAIPDATFDASEGAFSGAGEDGGQDAWGLAISTPGEPFGRFYDIHAKRNLYTDWWSRHVTLDEAIDAGRISREWADNRKKQWGATSTVYLNRVEGEFAADDEAGIIPLAWIEKANERWYKWQAKGFPGEFTAVGVDVGSGGEGSDKTVMALAFDQVKIKELRKFPRGDEETATMETAGRTKGILDKLGGKALIDVIGIGLGVFHRLREQGMKGALAFNAAEKAERLVNGKPQPVRDKTEEFGFVNKRAAAWWIMRELLDPVDGAGVALQPDDELTGELTAPRWRVASGARIQVESKDDIKKRIHRSTDSADAVIQALAGPELCSPGSSWRKSKFMSV